MSLIYGIFIVVMVAATLFYTVEILTIILVIIERAYRTVRRWVHEA